jgi:hypothetical protein
VVLCLTTKIPAFRGFSFSKSPLTDSNRRPPPYHGGFGPQPGISREPLATRFPCIYPGFFAFFQPFLEAPSYTLEAP